MHPAALCAVLHWQSQQILQSSLCYFAGTLLCPIKSRHTLFDGCRKFCKKKKSLQCCVWARYTTSGTKYRKVDYRLLCVLATQNSVNIGNVRKEWNQSWCCAVLFHQRSQPRYRNHSLVKLKQIRNMRTWNLYFCAFPLSIFLCMLILVYYVSNTNRTIGDSIQLLKSTFNVV